MDLKNLFDKTKSILERIEKRGKNFVVLPKEGDRVLGTHRSKKSAVKQIQAIEISKARRGG